MRKFYIMVLIAILVLSIVTPAVAGGGKVRGENGQGEVHQEQVMNPPPFPDTQPSAGFLRVADNSAIP